MAEQTGIEWTDATWNPIRGCSRISPGCVNCYAERMAARGLPGMNSPTTGEPFAIMTPSGPRWTGKLELIRHMLDVPLKRRKPTTYFVNSMSDLFHESLSFEDIDRVFAVMAQAKQHTFQVLTKRADRMLHVMTKVIRTQKFWPMPNVWFGVSVEDQKRADERIPLLIQTPAAVRFLSVEPLLGPVGLKFPDGAGGPRSLPFDFHSWTGPRCEEWFQMQARATYMTRCETVDWVIVGGESGPGARPCDVAWIRSIVAQCKAAGVACFVKQLGAHPTGPEQSVPDWVQKLDPKGGNPEEWPADLRVRQMPEWRA